MNISFIGAGKVGAPLAARLAEHGHQVTLAEVRPGSSTVAAALTRSDKLTAAPLGDALADAEIVFVAIPFGAVVDLLGPLAAVLAGKILVDCTNPVGPGLSHGLKSERSGSEAIQALLEETHVTKAFSIYGYENFENPEFEGVGVRPAMLFCGDDAGAKSTLSGLIDACGFEPVDVGGLVQALHLEHMTLLWVRMVRAHGHSPHLTWAALK